MMTDEQRRIARNEASRRCRMKKLAEKAKNAKKPGAKTTRKAERKQSKQTGFDEKRLNKFVSKHSKTTASISNMMKDAVEIMKDAYKSEDETAIEKVKKAVRKTTNASMSEHMVLDENGNPTKNKAECVVQLVLVKRFRIPAKFVKSTIEADLSEADPSEVDSSDEIVVSFDDSEEEKNQIEIPVDPDDMKNLVENPDEDKKLDLDEDEENFDEDEDEDDSEDEDEDEDDSDDEYENDEDKRWAEEQALDDDYAAGRWEAMNEFDAQGVGEED